MNARIVAAAAALILALTCNAAAAGAHASARLSDLHIQLYSIGNTDPSVTFTVLNGSTANAVTFSSSPGLSSESHAGGGAAFAAVETSSPSSAAIGSFAQIAGDVFGSGGSMLATAFSLAGASSAEGSAALLDGNSYASFTLSAGTVMVVTGMADIEVQADAGRPADYAVGSIDLEQDDSAQTSAAHSLAVAGDGAAANGTRHVLLSIAFTNSLDFAINGAFFAGVDATAVSTVPEPASAALLLAGLALVSGARRRARSRQA
jgi:hypothetical protein